MPFISRGEIIESKPQSIWRISILSDVFWGVINFVILFFRTILNPSATSRGDNYSSGYRVSGQGPDPFGPGGGPRRRMGGFRGGAGAPSCPPMAGGG